MLKELKHYTKEVPNKYLGNAKEIVKEHLPTTETVAIGAESAGAVIGTIAAAVEYLDGEPFLSYSKTAVIAGLLGLGAIKNLAIRQLKKELSEKPTDIFVFLGARK